MADHPFPTEALFCFLIALAAFCAFFFTVDFPEIRHGPVDLKVQAATMVQSYCCSFRCICDYSGEELVQKCSQSDAKEAETSLSPQRCSSMSSSVGGSNTTVAAEQYCPATGPEAMCDGGYYCCGSCGEDGCCDSSDHALCQLKCDVCYTVDLTVTVLEGEGAAASANISAEFGTRATKAQRFLDGHAINSTFHGYRKPGHSGVILLTRQFTAHKWGLLVIFALPLFLISTVLTHHAIAAHAIPRFYPRDIPHDRESDLTLSWNLALWLGVVWPLLVLLPILLVGGAVSTDAWRKALYVLIPDIAALGWAFLIGVRLGDVGWGGCSIFNVILCLWLVPIGVLLPILLVLPHTRLPLSIVGGILLLVFVPSLILGPPGRWILK